MSEIPCFRKVPINPVHTHSANYPFEQRLLDEILITQEYILPVYVSWNDFLNKVVGIVCFMLFASSGSSQVIHLYYRRKIAIEFFSRM